MKNRYWSLRACWRSYDSPISKSHLCPGKPGNLNNTYDLLQLIRESAKMYWCGNCNVPILTDKCELCEKPGIVLTRDLKPVFSSERSRYIHEFSDSTISEIPHNLFRFKNKIIANGKVLFSFHVNENCLEFNIKRKITLRSESENKDLQIKSLLRANQRILEKRESEAIEFIKRVANRHKSKLKMVSFSGGKDSAITAYLVKKAIGKVPLLFSNTGIEFPETVKFAREFAKKMDLDLIEIHPPQRFVDLCKELGPPSRMMRWCCFTQKAAPINTFYSNLHKDVLSFDGIRRSESKSRAKFERLRKNTKIIRQFSAYPIFEWCDFEVWLYLFFRKIPMNPLYEKGYSRIGCWACPNNSKFDGYLLSKTHPGLSKKWASFLLEYAEKHGRKPDWVYNGKWKQRTTKYKKFEICSLQKTCSVGNEFLFVLRDSKFTEDKLEFFKVFGKKVVKDLGNEKLVQIIGPKVTIASFVDRNTMRVRFNEKDSFNRSMFEIRKQLEKALNCVNCGACIGSCRFGAIEFTGHLRIDEKKCNHCLECVTSKHLKQSCITLHYKRERNIVQSIVN